MKNIFFAFLFMLPVIALAQTQKGNKHQQLPAYKSGVYRNFFLEA